jgi:hypothetical protein
MKEKLLAAGLLLSLALSMFQHSDTSFSELKVTHENKRVFSLVVMAGYTKEALGAARVRSEPVTEQAYWLNCPFVLYWPLDMREQKNI